MSRIICMAVLALCLTSRTYAQSEDARSVEAQIKQCWTDYMRAWLYDDAEKRKDAVREEWFTPGMKAKAGGELNNAGYEKSSADKETGIQRWARLRCISVFLK